MRIGDETSAFNFNISLLMFYEIVIDQDFKTK